MHGFLNFYLKACRYAFEAHQVAPGYVCPDHIHFIFCPWLGCLLVSVLNVTWDYVMGSRKGLYRWLRLWGTTVYRRHGFLAYRTNLFFVHPSFQFVFQPSHSLIYILQCARQFWLLSEKFVLLSSKQFNWLDHVLPYQDRYCNYTFAVSIWTPFSIVEIFTTSQPLAACARYISWLVLFSNFFPHDRPEAQIPPFQWHVCYNSNTLKTSH